MGLVAEPFFCSVAKKANRQLPTQMVDVVRVQLRLWVRRAGWFASSQLVLRPIRLGSPTEFAVVILQYFRGVANAESSRLPSTIGRTTS